MMKKHKKLIAVTGVGVITAAGAVAVTTNAKADQSPATDVATSVEQGAPKTAEEAQAHYDQANQQLSNAKQATSAAKGSLDQANQTLTNAKNQQTAQQKVVNDEQTNVNKAQSAVDGAKKDVAQAQQLVDQATPAAIKDAQSKIADQNAQISTASEAVDKANQAIATANSGVEDATQSESAAQAQVNQQSATVDRAEQAVQSAQNILNNAGSDKAQQALDAAKKQVATDQQKLQEQSSAVASAQAAKQTADAALADANKKAAAAQSDYANKGTAATSAQQDYEQAQTTTKDAQAKVTKDQSDLKNVNDQLNNLNSIILPDGYVKALEAYQNDHSEANSQALTDLIQKAKVKNEYKNNRADEDRQVTFGPNDPMPAADQQELTVFVAQLLNALRGEFGAPLFTVNDGSLEFAKLVAAGYDADSWNMWKTRWHDSVTINKVAQQMGLEYGSTNPADNDPANVKQLEQYYENLESSTWDGQDQNALLPQTHRYSMNDLKAKLYDAVTQMLFDDADSQWGHAIGLLNNAGMSKSQDFGVAVDSMEQLHFLMIASYFRKYGNAVPGGQYDQLAATTVPVPDQLTSLQTQKTNLTKQLATDSDQLTKVQADETAKKTANETAQANLTTAKQALDAANSAVTPLQTAADQAATKLTDAQTKQGQLQEQLKTDTATQSQAQQALGLYQADLATKRANVDQAKKEAAVAKQALGIAQQDLQTKQGALADANANLTTKQQELTTANDKLTADQGKLTQLKQALADLQNAPMVLAQKQQALTAQEEALKLVQAELTAAKEELQKREQAATTAQRAVDKAQADYDQALAAQNKAQGAVDYAKSQLWNDAKKYGDVITIAPITIKAGEQLPAMTITNPTGQGLANNGATQAFLALAAIPAAATMIPAGTFATWANPGKANADRMVPGVYTEDVIVFYPDNSRSDTTVTVTVLANPAATPEVALPNGLKVVNGQVVDAQGNPVAGWSVKDGKVYNLQGQLVADFSLVHQGNGAHDTQAPAVTLTARGDRSSRLPQTGNQSQAGLALVGLTMLTALAGILGLRKRI